MSGREAWSVQLPIVFGLVVASLVAATLFTQWQLAAIGRASRGIADDYAPSIEHLTDARGEMRHLQLALRDYVDDQKTGAAARPDAVEDARKGMDDAITSYLALPNDAAERQLWGDILRTKDALNLAVERCLSGAMRRDFPATDALLRNVSTAADALSIAITRDVELNAEHSHASAVHIEHVYERSTYLACLLAAACVAIALGGAVTLRRAMSSYARLEERHRALLEVRASELEEFAGRIAHDILSPLSTVSLVLNAVSGTNAALVGRGTSAIRRIDRLVGGLLAFAVAGARPDEGAAADVRAVIADLAPELRDAAGEAGTKLETHVEVDSEVACHPGVLTSIVSNLARNAIKYIGDGPARRIDIRATEARSAIRIEVEDSGPGLPPEVEGHVFDPYVQGKNAKKGGIGLGLATVKRVVTAHGGSVGVKSSQGAGCMFWVELPKSATITRDDAHATRLQS